MLCGLLSVCLVLGKVPHPWALLSALRIVQCSGLLSNIIKGKGKNGG